MGFFHLLNCLLLASGPHFVLYKTSGLSEYNAFWKCGEVSFAYIMTQLSKMVFLATFFPSISPDTSGTLGTILDVLRTTVDISDLFGIYFVLNYLSGKGQFKVLVGGLGWAVADLVLTKYLPIWFGTRGFEFDWAYMRLGFEANLDLVIHLSTTMLVWLVVRKDLSRPLFPIVVGCLASVVYKPLIFQLLMKTLLLSPIALLLVKTLFAIALGILSLNVYIKWRNTCEQVNGKFS